MIKIEDIYGTEVDIKFSRSGYYRIDFKNEEFFPERVHNGVKVPNCLSFDEDNARLLYHSLKKMIERE